MKITALNLGTQAMPRVIHKTPGVTAAHLFSCITYMPAWEIVASVTTCPYQAPSIVCKESRKLCLAQPSVE